MSASEKVNSSKKWWFCLLHQRVEDEHGCANAERLGPFDTEQQAADALELARKRNEQWDEGEDEWGGKSADGR